MKIKLLLLVLLASFSAGYAQLSSVSIVGSAAGGWPGEVTNPGPTDNLQLTSTDGEHWTFIGLTLNSGEAKFRADNNWTLNWGAADFPAGTGTQGGANIVCIAGTYDVSFNSTTGAYAFTPAGPVAAVQLVGSGISTTLSTFDGTHYNASNTTLPGGAFQFLIDGNTYGGNTFPYGILTGPTLYIPVTAGTYASISVNIASGDYSFTVATPIENPVISLNGDAIGGWGDGFDQDMTSSDGIHYSYDGLITSAGLLKFRTDHAWLLNYASLDFPSGNGALNGPEIPVPAGIWNVTFNRSTGAYDFISTYGSVSLVGAGAGGWPGDPGNPGPVDIHQMATTDGINYTLYNVALTDGEVKFRLNNEWTINWGAADFPNGVGVQGGPNVPVVAGNYTVNFNKVTGEYFFAPPLRIAIVGSAAGGWPTGEAGEIDAHPLEFVGGSTFRLNNITLTDGEVKFRQDNSWDVNWGGTSLFGTLVLDGPSIPVSAGSYSVSLNRTTGTYQFADPLGVTKYETSSLKVYPNPTQNNWNLEAAQDIETVQIVDLLGKVVVNVQPKSTTTTVDASALQAGIYFAKIGTAGATQTIKLVKN